MKPSQTNSIFYILPVTILSLLFISACSEGMFMDGMIYAAVGHNISNGIGSLWNLSFSNAVFNEHPPLVFGIESIFFKLFGHSYLIEKFYSIITAIVTAILIHSIWKTLARDSGINQSHSWIPLLFWITTPIIFWTYQSNMLENTMGLFALASSYSLIKASQKKNMTGLLIATFFGGLFIVCGFLSKGFPALYPLAIPAILSLTLKKGDYQKQFIVTSSTVLFVGFIALTIHLSQPEAIQSLNRYLSTQVVSALKGELVKVRRTYILERLVLELAPAILLTVILFFSSRKGIEKSSFNKSAKNLIAFVILVGLSSSLPIVISPKQLNFYIVPSIPWFALALAVMISPVMENFQNRHQNRLIKLHRFKWTMFAIPVLILVLSFTLRGYSRDKELIIDVKTIGNELGDRKVVSVSSSLGINWSMIAYFQRYYFISIDLNETAQPFLLITKGEAIPEGYTQIKLNTSSLELLKKANQTD